VGGGLVLALVTSLCGAGEEPTVDVQKSAAPANADKASDAGDYLWLAMGALAVGAFITARSR
jgi:hypothetical protein